MSCGPVTGMHARVHVKRLGIQNTVAAARMAHPLPVGHQLILRFSKLHVRDRIAMHTMMLRVHLCVVGQIMKSRSVPHVRGKLNQKIFFHM